MNGSVPEFLFIYDEAGHLVGKYDGNGNPLWETVWLGDLPVARALAERAILYRAGSSRQPASDHRRHRRGGVAVEPRPLRQRRPLGRLPTSFAARAMPCIDHDLV